jgi:uncharacterized damage-inducible protein DinB
MRPEQSEYAPYAHAYVSLVPGDDVVKALAAQTQETERLLDSVKDPSHAYAPGKWTIKQVFHHMIDTERVFAYRVLTIARNDSTALPGFEQDDWMQFTPDIPMNALRDEYRAVRASTLALLRNLPAEALLRRGKANNYDVTARGLVWCLTGHELHHTKILRDKYLA